MKVPIGMPAEYQLLYPDAGGGAAAAAGSRPLPAPAGAQLHLVKRAIHAHGMWHCLLLTAAEAAALRLAALADLHPICTPIMIVSTVPAAARCCQ